jgi:hypothetical protein
LVIWGWLTVHLGLTTALAQTQPRHKRPAGFIAFSTAPSSGRGGGTHYFLMNT